MSHKVLFVCQANVCRSPLMAFEFAASLASSGETASWSVSSRGTTVPSGTSVCDLTAELAMRSRTDEDVVHAHVPTEFSDEALDSYDLILVATKTERARIAQAAPTLRARTFTLREAISLGEAGAAIPGEREALARLRDASDADDLRVYAQLLHGRRGLVAPGRGQRRAFLAVTGVRREDPFDIPDAHHEKAKAHRAVLQAVQTDVRMFHSQVANFLAAA